MRKKFLSMALMAALCLSMVVPAVATSPPSELEMAAAYVREHGIMTGDQNGNLNLDAGLNRAQLAVILTRLSDETGDMGRNAEYYRTVCPFTDVPEWAMPYAGYCAEKKLMSGYGNRLFGPNDAVTPAAACTVLLRYLGCPDSQWNYSTACDKAMELGLLPADAAAGSSISRGNIAILLYRALNGGNPASPLGVGTGYLANGKPVTEDNVLELLRQLERDWPYGTVWGTHDMPGTCKNEVPSTAANRIMDVYWVSEYYGCSGYASMISSLIFGDKANPGRRVDDLTQIRPGDILFRVRNDTGSIWHVVIALETPNEIGAFHYTDGNHGGIIRWPDKEDPYERDNLDCYGEEGKTYRLEAWTRYPENVPLTGESVEAWPTTPNS